MLISIKNKYHTVLNGEIKGVGWLVVVAFGFRLY